MAKAQWLNNLRTIATIAVILVHIIGFKISKFGSIDDMSWHIANFIGSSIRFCVPVFLMISGVLLLGKEYSIKFFLQKRFTRILLPFIFWSIIYILRHIQSNNIVDYLISFIGIIRKPISFHLWYIYMLIGIYLFLPIINIWIKNATKYSILYFIIIWFFLLFLELPILNKINSDIDVRYFTGYIGYPILGYYINTQWKQITNFRYKSLILYIVCSIATFLLTFYFSNHYGKFTHTFYNYLTPNIALQSIGIFILFYFISIKNKFSLNIINVISKYSFGIYLCHILVLSLLQTLLPSLFLDFSIINTFIILFLCLSISCILTFTINKIPYIGKRISG